jgi:hypothetical protein
MTIPLSPETAIDADGAKVITASAGFLGFVKIM